MSAGAVTHPQHYRLSLNRLGLWLFILSESMIFLILLFTRFYLFGVERPEALNQALGLAVTSILLLSSFTAYRAEADDLPLEYPVHHHPGNAVPDRRGRDRMADGHARGNHAAGGFRHFLILYDRHACLSRAHGRAALAGSVPERAAGCLFCREALGSGSDRQVLALCGRGVGLLLSGVVSGRVTGQEKTRRDAPQELTCKGRTR